MERIKCSSREEREQIAKNSESYGKCVVRFEDINDELYIVLGTKEEAELARSPIPIRQKLSDLENTVNSIKNRLAEIENLLANKEEK